MAKAIAAPTSLSGHFPTRRHVLDLDDFTREEIELVLNTADAMKEVLRREIKKVPTLRGKTVVNLFYEASSRTRVSFELAAKSLSAEVVNIATATSSVAKGESLLDTLRTLEALGADILVMRHWQSGAPYIVVPHVRSSILNAGDGSHAHPSQALLDMYTIREYGKTLEGLKVVIVGDILHSRVARSNLWGMSIMGSRITLCAPPTLLPTGPEGSLDALFPLVNIEYRLDRALIDADVVMVLRLQKERHTEGLLPDLREYVQLYQVTDERLSRAKPDVIVMHPGPINEGVEITPEVAYGLRSVIQEQVTNGVAIRMALLFLMAGGQGLED